MPESRVLLLNPPGKKLYLRDYYCSKVSQADYLNAPIDLLFASGQLRDCAQVELIDAVAESLESEDCIDRVAAFQPELVLGLIASVSYPEDLNFYRRLRERTGGRIVLSGDILRQDPEQRLRQLPFASALLHDFSSPALRRYLQGCRRPEDLPGLTFRAGNAIAQGPPAALRGADFQIGVPMHALFTKLSYRHPFVKSRRFATVLTDFGCPYRCNFCVMPGLGWKLRQLESVTQELQELRALGIREIFFLDQTFGLSRPRTRQLLAVLRRLGFGWVCFGRPDLLEPRLLREMSAAGCHTMILGLESGSERILEAAEKDYGLAEIERGFQSCRQAGIRTVATVVLGLPEETEETFQRTLELLDRLRPDFASFNVAVPRMTTPLRQRALRLGLIEEGLEVMDQSGSPVSMPSLHLSREQIGRLKRKAVRHFYGRPGFLLRRLEALMQEGGRAEWVSHVRQGAALARGLFS